MDGQPLVSVVIPFYNCEYIDQAIESALQQSYPHLQVVVVNDGSLKHREKVEPYFQRIVYIEKGNGGTASALNAGIRRAAGDYFAWLSADDLYDRRKIEGQLAFMQKKNADISYTSYWLINPENEIISGPAGVYYPSKAHFYERMNVGCFINGCTVMAKMQVFDRVGLFDERLRFTHDYDLWLRLLPRYDFHYLAEPLVKYRVHPNMGTKRFHHAIIEEIRFVQEKHRGSLENLIRRERGM